jgi:hypothetical protein
VAILTVVFLLFLIAAFGVGFILNMFTKRRPWTSTVVAAVLAGYFTFKMEALSHKFVMAFPILVGGLLASVTIRTLQKRGFKMFG